MAYIEIEIPTEYKEFNELDCEELDYFIRDKQSDRVADDLSSLRSRKIKEAENGVFDIIQLYKFLDEKEGI